jgi:Tfp pilus assembly protein PilP
MRHAEALSFARPVRWLVVAACVAVPVVAAAQATTKLPEKLPVPQTTPGIDPSVGKPLQPAPTAQAAPAAPAPAAPAPAAPAGDRDPFSPLVTKAPEGENRPSLSGLRLVGVVWDPVRRDQIRALVETPDGLGYYVRMNEEKFGGRVVAIERDRVRFSVREQDPSGQSRVRMVELKLN